MFSSKSITLVLTLVVLLLASIPAAAQNGPADQSLPEKLGEYRAAGPIISNQDPLIDRQAGQAGVTSVAGRFYVSKSGDRFFVSLATTISDSAAYARLTQTRREAETSTNAWKVENAAVGTAAALLTGKSNSGLAFFKGRAFVLIRDEKGHNQQALINFGNGLADTLDKGAGEVPVLVKHLPGWPGVESTVFYAVDKDSLMNVFSNQAIIEVLDFQGGAEAAVSTYGQQKLAIVEFNTASLATDNNQRITQRLKELREQGQPAPTAYRRIGNYAVFVFDAPDQETANQLLGQVKYQQVVTWLGENPFSYEQATREFTETTLGVLVSVVKASGIALVSCLAIGGLAGAILFNLRRSQQRAREAYADSDAMLRLNIDELTPERDSTRLLGSGRPM